MLEHPWIDFDGDGHGDRYDTYINHDGGQQFEYHDGHGHTVAIAYDNNHDGLIDSMSVDDNHDGGIDRDLTDTNGDGIMDRSEATHAPNHGVQNHPYIDFNGDGHGDRYNSYTYGEHGDVYTHSDGHGHVDAKAVDWDGDGLINYLYVDQDHNGTLEHALVDTNGDGIMDEKYQP
jgi:hypothetical protein